MSCQARVSQPAPMTAAQSSQPTARRVARRCACGGAVGPAGECQSCRDKRLTSPKRGGSQLPPIVEEVLRSPGEPLARTTRDFMEPRFGHDFGRVRVHNGARAAESARAVGARAYTVGNQIVFAANTYAPATHDGRGLLAHELAHTIQQRSPAGPPPSSEPHGIHEVSANRAERAVANGKSIITDLPRSGLGLARTPDPEAERAAAIAEALASLARSKQEEEDEKERERKEEEETVFITPMALGGKVAPRRVPRPKPARLPGEGDYERYTAPLFAEIAENNKKLEAEYAQEREIVKKPYKKRLAEVQRELVRQSSFWHDPKKARRLMTADEVWLYGMNNGYFVEREKKFVYEDQKAMHEYIRQEQEEKSRRERVQRDNRQYNEHVARGKQLSAPGPIVTSFALPGLGAVGVAIGGAQTGAMVGDAINKCRSGTAGDCAAAVAPAVAAVVVHKTVFKTPGGGRQNRSPTIPPRGGGSPQGGAGSAPAKIEAVTPAQVREAYKASPFSVRKSTGSDWHQQQWERNGGTGPAPIAFRTPGGMIRVDENRWLAVGNLAEINTPADLNPRLVPAPPRGKTHSPDALAKTPPAGGRVRDDPSPVPLGKTPPADALGDTPPAQPAAGRQTQFTPPPAPKAPAATPRPRGPTPVREDVVAEAHRINPNVISHSYSSQFHEMVWRYNHGVGKPPIAFRIGDMIRIDIARWPAHRRALIGL